MPIALIGITLSGGTRGEADPLQSSVQRIQHAKEPQYVAEVEECCGQRARAAQNEQEDVARRRKESVENASRWAHEHDVEIRRGQRALAGLSKALAST